MGLGVGLKGMSVSVVVWLSFELEVVGTKVQIRI